MPPDTDSTTTDTNRPGRPRQHPDSAARTRAWRQRRRSETASPALEAPVGPELAQASLSVVLDQLRQVATGDLATLAQRIEGAVASLADPAQVEEALAKARTEAARQIATVEAQMAEACAVARRAEDRMVEAEEVTESAIAQVEELEAEKEALNTRVTQAEQGTEAIRRLAVQEGQRLRDEHQAEIDQIRGESDVRVAEADEVRARVLGQLDLLGQDLEIAQCEGAQMVERAVAGLTERLGERHQADLQVAQARYEAELARCEAQCHTSNQIALERRYEVERLVHQLAAAEHRLAGVTVPGESQDQVGNPG